VPLWCGRSSVSGRPRLTVATEARPPSVAPAGDPGRPRGARRETERSCPLGRALDLGAASTPPSWRGPGWEAVGIDYVPTAVEAAPERRRVGGLGYVAGDATRLPPARSTAAALMDASGT
jgi:hypothetical protein